MLRLNAIHKRNAIYIFPKIHTTSVNRDYDDENVPKIEKIKEKIGFIGDGNMANAICRGIVNNGLISYSQVFVASPYEKKLQKWKKLGANVSTDNTETAILADIVILAVKPPVLPEVIEGISESQNGSKIKNKLFISVLAGVKLAKLEKFISKYEGCRMVRLMPNTPMLVGIGCTAYCTGKNVTSNDISIVRAILEATSICQKVPEHMMNAVTALSGGGPSFTYLIIEAMSDGGVKMGLHRDMATKFAAQTVMGAAKMVLEGSKHTGQLKDEVCSAGGTTIAGMHALERGAVRGSIINAIEAAAKRADELGKDS